MITIIVAFTTGLSVQAAIITIPDSALATSTQYYTDTIGGGIGTALIMTGGGSGANVGNSRNDDGFSGPISLGFTLDFFGNTYSEFWANNNGNISFTAGISSFTPTGPQGAAQPIISPFFGDVDTRNVNSGLMYLRNDIADQIIVTWDQVGYYNSNADLLNSFQLVLRGSDYVVPVGEGNIGFFWNTMEWETGDASGGINGFGGTPAAVGFGDGAGNGVILESSLTHGISGVVNNQMIWFNPNLEPISSSRVTVPEPGTMLLMGIGLIALVIRRRKSTSI